MNVKPSRAVSSGGGSLKEEMLASFVNKRCILSNMRLYPVSVTHETLDAAAGVLPAEAIDAIERAATSAHRHDELFSERAANIKQSAVRDVFDISMRPGLVSLAGGSPYLQSLPLERLGDTAAKIIAEQGLTALQYGSGQGTEELRTQICEVMAAEGILDADPRNVVITAGSQSAQDVAAKVFCNPGDVVLVEDPTYVGALNTFEAYQVEVETVRWTSTA